MKSGLAGPRPRQRDFWVTDGADSVSHEWPSVGKKKHARTRCPSCCGPCARLQFPPGSYRDGGGCICKSTDQKQNKGGVRGGGKPGSPCKRSPPTANGSSVITMLQWSTVIRAGVGKLQPFRVIC